MKRDSGGYWMDIIILRVQMELGSLFRILGPRKKEDNL